MKIRNNKGNIILLVLTMFVILASLNLVSGAYVYSSSFTGLGSGYSSSSYQYQPSFQTYYGSSVSTYWPILTDRETCLARQDIVLQVSPAGCQPMTVRSDLIADQNVPVFCQIDALQLNPSINVKEIRNIQFTGSYPKEVANVGFHPARAALNTRDRLLGSPLLNNIGYVVVVLKRTPNESALPNFVSLNLTGTIEYDAGNAFGIGLNEFYVQPTNDLEWQTEGVKNSFWDGKYFVRVESADTDYAVISLYDGIRKIASRRVKIGEKTEPIYMPGYYCQFGLQISYESLIKSEDKARIEISDGSSTNVIDVYKGSRIINEKCTVQDIYVDPNTGSTGNIRINCGSNSILLQKNAVLSIEGLPPGQISHRYTENKEECRVDFSDGSAYYITRNYNSKTGQSAITDVWTPLQSTGVKSTSATTTAVQTTPSSADTNKIRDKLIQACVISDEPLNGKTDDPAELAFNDAVKYYERVADEYPNEAETGGVGSKKYGQLALQAILGIINEVKSKQYSKAQTEVRIMSKIVSIYPELAQFYNSKINEIYSFDSGLSVASVNVDNKFRTITLLSLSKPNKGDKAEAVFMYGNSELRLKPGEVKSLPGKGNAKVNLTVLEANRATITTNCVELASESERRAAGSNYRVPSETLGTSRTFVVSNTGTNNELVCGIPMILSDTVLQKVAKVRISPVVEGTQGKTNLSVKIGIEKRAIKLSPEKAKQVIANINDSVKKWEAISNNLVKLEKGLKGACLATGAAFTIKNFFSGIDGTSAARQEVMSGKNGWNDRCANSVKTGKIDLNGDGNLVQAKGTYTSVSQCLGAYGTEIEADVLKRKNILTNVNGVVKNIQSDKQITQNEVVNQDKAIKALYDKLPQECKNRLQAPINRTDKPNEQYAPYSYSELVDYYKNCMILQDSRSNIGAIDSLNASILQAKNNFEEFNKLSATAGAGGFLGNAPKSPGSSGSTDMQGIFYTLKEDKGTLYLNGKEVSLDKSTLRSIQNQLTNNVASAFLIRDATITKTGSGKDATENKSGAIVIGDTGANAKLQQKAVYKYEETLGDPLKITLSQIDNGGTNEQSTLNTFRTLNKIDSIQQFGQGLYGNKIRDQDKKVLYFISGPDKDLPAQVPFDVVNGWYVKVESKSLNLGTNTISSYDTSGLPKRWQICNVGDDHMINQNDRCQEVVQSISTSATILGLDERTSKDLVSRSQRALLDAASQKGSASKSVNILGQRMDVGAVDPLSNVQCQNFMSAAECKILFNVCDPVICSPSRCDMGGQYKVANVQQTGIIGSVALCWPNINEGIALPVCVSGIRNGIDAYVSLLKQHRDCLQQNIDDGRLVGVCDEIQSIYLCEFFWRQMAPIAQMLIPKLLTGTFSKGEGQYRGGGEYLLAQKAWDNAQASMNYFTQYYGENALKSFQIRSVEEAGTDVCKGFVSTTIPTKLKTLIEPDSPPQFTARFDEIPYSSVTVPATSQYKIFYFINAGKDSGVYYSVYLKSPPESGFYYSTQTIMVASGYLSKGQSASETLDRTLPEGYKQICVRVNNQEECGFKQTSTDFAVNYLKDKYVQNELENTSITSQSTCVSGAPSIGSVVANLNPQAAAAEALMPQVSQRGIVRICATNNPGGTTDPTRYVNAGYCGDPKMRCWLDKNSVGNAISNANIGARNETLSQLEAKQMKDLFAQPGILDNGTAVESIRALDNEAKTLSSTIKKGVSSNASVIAKADNLYLRAVDLGNMLILNNHKAWLSYVAGEIKQIKIDYYLSTTINVNPKASTTVSKTSTSTGCDRYGDLKENSRYYLDENDNNYVFIDVEDGSYYINNNDLMYAAKGSNSYTVVTIGNDEWKRCLYDALKARQDSKTVSTTGTIGTSTGTSATVVVDDLIKFSSPTNLAEENKFYSVDVKDRFAKGDATIVRLWPAGSGYDYCVNPAEKENGGIYALQKKSSDSWALGNLLYFAESNGKYRWGRVGIETKYPQWVLGLETEMEIACDSNKVI